MAYAFVQQKEASSDGEAVTVLDSGATDAPITAGNTLIAAVHCRFFAAETVSLSDVSGSNDVWTQIGTDLNASGRRLALYRLENAAAGTLNLRSTWSGAVADPCIAVFEFSGLKTASFDKTAQQYQFDPGAGADAVSSGNTATLASEPSLVFGISMEDDSGAAPTAGTGYTSLTSIWNMAGGFALLARPEHKRVTATTAVAATFARATAGKEHWTFAATFLEAEVVYTDAPDVLRVVRSGIRLR